MANDTTPVQHWFTYAEAAEQFGISSEAVRQVGLRRKWRRRRLNSDPYGKVQIEIPEDDPIRSKTGDQHPNEIATGALRELEIATRALREQVSDLRVRAERAEAEADRTIATLAAFRADHERERTVLAELLAAVRADLDRERGRADQAEARATASALELREAAETAEAKAGELQQTIDALRRKSAHDAAEAKDAADRPAMVASKIDEVQFRRLQEADQARKSLGRLARIRAAWRGE
jgi:chromosome segregation ATPase